MKEKKLLDDYINEVDYSFLKSSRYVPSTFALEYMNFIKLVNGEQGETHKTPPMHLAMLDKLTTGNKYIVNICARGLAKTTLFAEYFTLYLATFSYLPTVGEVDGMLYVADSMENGAKNARQNIEMRYENSDFLKQYVPKAKFTDTFIQFTNIQGKHLGIKLYGANTGVRGTKIYNKRPKLCVLDDLMDDEAAKSKTITQLIKDTIYKGVFPALDPNNYMVIFNGTPFSKNDPLVEAVESGAWAVNAWPVCEKFPCPKEEFRGAWEDRFGYDAILERYNLAEKTGHLDAFYQEYMLRIASEDERLIQDTDIRWYSSQDFFSGSMREFFNFYITTDFATSIKETADYTVLSVWAYNFNGDWYLVDGICHRETMNITFDKLFRLVQEWKPQSVAIEVTGQQAGFVSLLTKEQLQRGIFFNFASSMGRKEPGIRPVSDKLSRFNRMVPLFKAGKIYLPREMEKSRYMTELLDELRLATKNGLKSQHDDILDTISQLSEINAFKPQEKRPDVPVTSREYDSYSDDFSPETRSNLKSYIV